jgi:hypothetical protein
VVRVLLPLFALSLLLSAFALPPFLLTPVRAQSPADPTLQGRVLMRSDGALFVYKDGVRYAVQAARVPDDQINAMPDGGTIERLDVMFGIPVQSAGPTSTPAPDPRAPGIRENPIPLRTLGNSPDGWQIAVLEVLPNVAAIPIPRSSSRSTPTPGSQLFGVRIMTTYTGPLEEGRGRRFSASDVKAVGSEAVVYSGRSYGCGLPDQLPSSEVMPGGSINGTLCWEIRATDLPSLVMFYDRMSYPPAPRLYFALR